MTSDGERPYVEPQTLTDDDLHVYEAIATLEQAGRAPTRQEITDACHLDDGAVATTLRKLIERRVIAEASGGPGYVLVRHDWSSVPDRPYPAPRPTQSDWPHH